MSDSEFATAIVELLEQGKSFDGDTMRESYYVWAWRRAREIHELVMLREAANRRPVTLVKMEDVG